MLLEEHYPALAVVAARLLGMHVTTCAAERNWSAWGLLFAKARNRLSKMRAFMLLYLRGNSTEVQRLRADEEMLLSLLEEPDEVEPAVVAAAMQPMELSDSEEEDPCKY